MQTRPSLSITLILTGMMDNSLKENQERGETGMKSYVIVGAGARARYMFARPIVYQWQATAKLAGIYDINPTRANLLSQECGGVPVYDSFDAMLSGARPDVVIVATVDSTHHEYIIRSLEAGSDCITEKPMTIDAEKCRAILEAERRTGKKVRVTFNARFNPYTAKIKELLCEGAIGEITHIHFEWNLDHSHGADYFRRWHRRMENSGGLLVHKSTHHFDLINWWLGKEPEEVFAYGRRAFYGATREQRGERCLTCSYQSSCEFYFDIESDEFTNSYYLGAEQEDGYIRDQCVFGEDITIYDSMSLNVRYEEAVTLNYSLIAYSPYEGWRAVIHGTKGRMEAEVYTSGERAHEPFQQIDVYDHRGNVEIQRVKKLEGGHGGSDVKLQRMLFVPDQPDPLGQQADSRAGAMSLCLGSAANRSIADNRPVRIIDLLEGVESC